MLVIKLNENLIKKSNMAIKYLLCLCFASMPFATVNANIIASDAEYSDGQPSDDQLSPTLRSKLFNLNCSTTVGACRNEINKSFTKEEIVEITEFNKIVLSQNPKEIQASFKKLMSEHYQENDSIYKISDPLNVILNSSANALAGIALVITISALVGSLAIEEIESRTEQENIVHQQQEKIRLVQEQIKKCENGVHNYFKEKQLSLSSSKDDLKVLAGLKYIEDQTIACRCHAQDNICRNLINIGAM